MSGHQNFSEEIKLISCTIYTLLCHNWKKKLISQKFAGKAMDSQFSKYGKRIHR